MSSPGSRLSEGHLPPDCESNNVACGARGSGFSVDRDSVLTEYAVA